MAAASAVQAAWQIDGAATGEPEPKRARGPEPLKCELCQRTPEDLQKKHMCLAALISAKIHFSFTPGVGVTTRLFAQSKEIHIE